MTSQSTADDKKVGSCARVGLCFTSPTLVPDRLTAALGISPSRCFTKGDSSPGKRVPRPWGLWALEYDREGVDEASKQLLETLEGKHDLIRQIAIDMAAETSTTIRWEPGDGYGGYSLSSETVAALANLAERMDFYFV